MLCAFRMCRKSPCKGYGQYPGMWSYRYPCKGVFKGHGRGRAEGAKRPLRQGWNAPGGMSEQTGRRMLGSAINTRPHGKPRLAGER